MTSNQNVSAAEVIRAPELVARPDRRLLAEDPAYARYMERVRWRWFPYLA